MKQISNKTLAAIVLASSAVSIVGLEVYNKMINIEVTLKSDCPILQEGFTAEVTEKKEEPRFLLPGNNYFLDFEFLDPKAEGKTFYGVDQPINFNQYRAIEVGDKVVITMYSKDGKKWYTSVAKASWQECPKK